MVQYYLLKMLRSLILSPTPQQHFSTLSLTPFQAEKEFFLVLMEVQSRAVWDPSEKRRAYYTFSLNQVWRFLIKKIKGFINIGNYSEESACYKARQYPSDGTITQTTGKASNYTNKAQLCKADSNVESYRKVFGKFFWRIKGEPVAISSQTWITWYLTY